jgi:peptide/nickel transport system substrate-binding protein
MIAMENPAGRKSTRINADRKGDSRSGAARRKPAALDLRSSAFVGGKRFGWHSAVLLPLLGLLFFTTLGFAQSGELRFSLHHEPKTFNPLQAEEDSSDTIVYLTAGVLTRVNRQSQALEPALATSWKITDAGRTITFNLRTHVFFSDGTPFTADDVAYSVRQLMDPALHSPIADQFRSGGGAVQTKVLSPGRISITFAAPVVGLDKLFDEVAIMSVHSPRKEMAVLGPFYVADHKPGAYVLLQRNPNYWKKDAAGHQLPYLEYVRLDIQPNRDAEALRLRRGEIHLINVLDSEYYDRLASVVPGALHDAGPGFDTEQMWFNQVPTAPLPAYKLAWFRSTAFRRAVSEAINRADICRVVYNQHAQPAIGPVSPANHFWFNAALKAHPYDTQSALRRLQQEGFRQQDGKLVDRDGHAVEFSLLTNAEKESRVRMAAMIQQDLGKIGITINLVTLDFPSLIERITQSFQYEAVLLGLINVDLDPNAQMNVWISSGENHQWNPKEASPATPWEAEIDKLMRAQASTLDPDKRKADFDRVQQIAWEQEPFIYLVHKNALSAISESVMGAQPVVLRPQTYWNIDTLWLKSAGGH